MIYFSERDESKALLLACIYAQYMQAHPLSPRELVENKFNTPDTEHLKKRAWEIYDMMVR